jgi:glutathione peroxidase
MTKPTLYLVTLFGLWALSDAAETPHSDKTDGTSAVTAQEANSVLDFTMQGIDGKPYPLAKHKGQVILLVNVASRCGYTRQYEGLQKLHDAHKDKGFTVIGVPANDFGAQEPGTNEEIKEFCSGKFHVTFPVLGKVHVKGEEICPLYQYLTTKGPKPGDISWNFNKYLIGRDGKPIDRYESKVEPEDADLAKAIAAALAVKVEKADKTK